MSESKIDGFSPLSFLLPFGVVDSLLTSTYYSPFHRSFDSQVHNDFSSHHPHDIVSLFTLCSPNGTVAAGVADNHHTKYDVGLNHDDLL